eukprot:489898-Pleurochrysis_carterae.AAC.2
MEEEVRTQQDAPLRWRERVEHLEQDERQQRKRRREGERKEPSWERGGCTEHKMWKEKKTNRVKRKRAAAEKCK